MTEKKESPNAYELHEASVVNVDDLKRFHKGVGVKNASCLRCGSPSWKLVGDDVLPAAVVPMIGSDAELTQTFIPLITLCCRNCGTLWFTAQDMLTEWLEENPKEGEIRG